MLQALRTFERDHRFTIDVVDVDQDAELVARYDELVPVLLGSKHGAPPIQLCHYFLDEAKLKVFFSD